MADRDTDELNIDNVIKKLLKGNVDTQEINSTDSVFRKYFVINKCHICFLNYM